MPVDISIAAWMLVARDPGDRAFPADCLIFRLKATEPEGFEGLRGVLDAHPRHRLFRCTPKVAFRCIGIGMRVRWGHAS